MKLKIYGVFLLLLLISLLPMACDQVTPRTKFILAVPRNEFSYLHTANQLKLILENAEFDIQIIYTKSALEAAQLVANNSADLCLIMNNSMFIVDSLGNNATRIRTILPLYRRSMFFYIKKDSLATIISPSISFINRTIKVEIEHGETQIGLEGMLYRAHVPHNYKFTHDSIYSIYYFWSSNYSLKHTQLLKNRWQCLSLDDKWIDFIKINNPELKAITIPAIPGEEGSKPIKTLYSETLLLGNSNLGENAVYLLTKYIYQNKARFINADRKFTTIDETYDRLDLLFSLHEGANAYLRRDKPTFLERYSDTIALIASIIAFIYAAIQTIRSRFRKVKKNKIDQYFIDFLIIKEKFISDKKTQIDLYESLFKKVLTEMTEDKMEISDFHILSRLIQQELLIIKLEK